MTEQPRITTRWVAAICLNCGQGIYLVVTREPLRITTSHKCGEERPREDDTARMPC